MSAEVNLADGQWHRLHPATPLLRGGIIFIAIIGFIIANMRERLVEIFFPAPGDDEYYDPISFVVGEGFLWLAILVVLLMLLLIVGGFFLSWRMHTFRVTEEAVEVRSGILFRTHRKAKLDRVQGVNIARPLLPRLVGAAQLVVAVAGQDGGVKLEYLYSRNADQLRRDVLTLASGVRLGQTGHSSAVPEGADASEGTPGVGTDHNSEAALGAGATGAIGGVIAERVGEFLAPELDPNLAAPDSVVRIPLGRIIGSAVVNLGTVIALIALALSIVGLVNEQFWALFWIVPGLIGLGSYYFNTITKSLRYSIAATASGIRVGYGLLSTSNDTIPPGRIYAIQVMQPFLWRPFGWWQVRINKAGVSATELAGGKGNTTVLPVGSLTDVGEVLNLLMPGDDAAERRAELDAAILRPSESGFVLSPRRAAWLDPFAWRRTGYMLHSDRLIFRHGVVWRKVDVLPLARVQSIDITQGPLQRLLRLATARAHSVIGPISALLPTMASDEAVLLFERTSAAIVDAAEKDTSHRWGEARER